MSRNDDDDEQTGIFSAIGPEQCVELLIEHSIGRVAWQSAEGQQILPATYAWFEGAVVFRTPPYGVLSDIESPPGPTEAALSPARLGCRSGTHRCGSAGAVARVDQSGVEGALVHQLEDAIDDHPCRVRTRHRPCRGGHSRSGGAIDCQRSLLTS